MSSFTVTPNRSDLEVEQSLGKVDLRCAPKIVTDLSYADFFLAPSRRLTGDIENEDFLLINKPPDVRMNGEFSVTVENIILYLRPDLRADQLRWVHRLDFATSGVLCVALTREAARHASIAFEERKTKKQYLAVLEGVLDTSQWPTLDYIDSLTREQKRQRLDSIPDFISEHSEQCVRTWQDKARDSNLSAALNALRKLHALSGGGDSEIEAMIALDEAHFLKDRRSRKALRKLLKARGVLEMLALPHSEATCFSDAAIEEKQLRKEMKVSALAERVKASETMRSEEEESYIYREVNGEGCETLNVRVPLAEVEGQFEVIRANAMYPGKDCETRVQVLEVGKYLGKDVTKVLFTPITGRRHQLRLHAQALGHPIVGDATYCQDYDSSCQRMMLHAWNLSLEFDRRYYNKGGQRTLELNSDDPFPIISGVLAPVLPRHVIERQRNERFNGI